MGEKRRLCETYVRDKKAFWKEAGRARKGVNKVEEMVKDVNGQMLVGKVKVTKRFKEYFEEFLKVQEDRETVTVTVGGGRMPVMGELNERPIGRVEVEEAVKSLKAGKATGLDGVTAELLKKGGESMVLWLERVLGLCFEESSAPRDFRDMSVVPCYKGKGDKYECNSYRGISLMSVVGKLYGRILINRVRKGTELAIGEEQCGFREGRGCVDQICVVRQLCEKYLAKGKNVYFAFLDLEKRMTGLIGMLCGKCWVFMGWEVSCWGL